MEDYSFLRDMLETWRSTTDWVKAVVVIAIPGQIVFLVHQILRHRAEQRAMIAEERAVDRREIRELVEAEICRIIAEREQARLPREGQARLTGDTNRRAIS